MLLVASDIVTNLFFSPVNVVLPNNVRIHKNVQGSRIRLVLGCVISPLRQHAESRNLGQTLFGSSVCITPSVCKAAVKKLYRRRGKFVDLF